jgi:prevent-host-death family protein
MKKASITETKNQLSALLDRVRHGETVLIVDRGRPVARLEPASGGGAGDPEGRLLRLERQGVVRRARATLSKSFLGRKPPRGGRGASISKALLADRRVGR